MRGPLFWIRAARAPFFTASLAPIVVGTAYAYSETGHCNWLFAGLAVLGLTALQGSANLSNDYYDHLSGNDAANTAFASPFTGGSRLIQQGIVKPWEMLVAALVAMGIGAAIGLYLTWQVGWPILALGLIGVVTGFFYTAPPLKLDYRGAGELFIFLDFGILPVVGAYLLQVTPLAPTAGLHLSWPVLAVGLPVAFMITGILWINQFQDMEADASVGKRHWVVRLGRRASAQVHATLLGLTYLSIIGAVVLHWLTPWSLLALLGLPLAAKSASVALRFHDDLPRLTPANAAMVGTHLVTSLLLALGLVLGRIL